MRNEITTYEQRGGGYRIGLKYFPFGGDRILSLALFQNSLYNRDIHLIQSIHMERKVLGRKQRSLWGAESKDAR